MKRIALLILGVMAVSTGAQAQGRGGAPPPPPPLAPGASQADVDKALLAAPANMKDQATVIKWKPDFTYDTLRKGTNRLVCYDRSGFPQQQPFSIQCTSIANLDREVQNLKAEAAGDRTKSEAILNAMEKDGTRVKPEYGSLWHILAGPDREHARPHHSTVAVPGATTQSTGLPDNPRQGGAWIMNAGTTTAHIMIPGQ
ncbi:MAG: hypothetical protein A3H97_13285 [Acidobacteria bacterium RIFCSPLOWO2_02_FULL_65_29]|nr:MAG: hypothetical protein A3H97_13285 [Acidobacteria bacterium RIFCSPLOWO2_02_FULL_65_29]